MARQIGSGSWLLAEEYYERGDPAFVDELRHIANPDPVRLGNFAPKWYGDRRPASRPPFSSKPSKPP